MLPSRRSRSSGVRRKCSGPGDLQEAANHQIFGSDPEHCLFDTGGRRYYGLVQEPSPHRLQKPDHRRLHMTDLGPQHYLLPT